MTTTYTAEPFTWHRGAELPGVQFWWLDSVGDLLDLSTHTIEVRVGKLGVAAVLVKTTGVSGAAGSGVEPTGVPNVQIDWEADDLDIEPGRYTLLVIATDGDGLDRMLSKDMRILDTVDPIAP